MGRIIKGAGLFILGVIVLGSSGGNKAGHAGTSDNSQTVDTSRMLKNYTATNLASAYAANSVAADRQFKGQRYRVSGSIDSINTSMWGSAYIVMVGGVNMFSNPQFTLADSEKARVATLMKGSFVTLVCDGSGDVAKTPMSDGCIFD